ncbi:macrolide transporter subunit MacA [Paenibacillus sp. L3-i20]|nr:macrolide transporter subunit MacA [Paenibacillus sp. L3-i20]
MLFRPKYRFYMIMSFILIMTLTGCSLLPVEEEPLKPPLVKPPQEVYRTAVVEKGPIAREIVANGALESYHFEPLEFVAGGGELKEVLVRAGSKVKKGDVLLQLETGNMDIELKQLELNMAKAVQAIKVAKLAEDSEALKIASLQHDVDQMKYKKLSKTLNSKQLIAGMDGVITFVTSMEPGEEIEAYETLIIISDPSKLRYSFQVNGIEDILSVKVGFKARVKFGLNELEGTVTQTPSSAPDTKDEQLRTRNSNYMFIEFDKLPDDVVIGQRGDVSIQLEAREDVLIIPRSGLRSYLDRKFVRVLEEENKIREVDVEIGIDGQTVIEIRKGLEEGQAIILQ